MNHFNQIDCKLLLFDLDGTLLDSNKTISPRNLAALEQCRAKGFLIGIATARSEPTCARFLAQVKPDVVISNGGALVRVKGKIIYHNAFTEKETAVLVKAGIAENRGVTVDCAENTYCNRVIDSPDWADITFTDFADFDILHESAFKVCIEGTDRTFAERTAALVTDCDWLPFSDCDWFKFSRAAAAKEKAIPPIERALGISREQIVSFGDDYVDAKMLQYCGIGVAMGNAIDEIKRCADVVIGNNDSDAIAAYLENNIL